MKENFASLEKNIQPYRAYKMLIIVDYNAGNIASIQNMLKKIGVSCQISDNPSDIDKADKLILPGVGSFDYGMNNLKRSGLTEIIKAKANKGIPLLGICLGAQLLGNSSQEGTFPGLGLINMEVVKFNFEENKNNLKIPHMGWNETKVKQTHPIFTNMYKDPRFYFVHSYHFKPAGDENVLTTTWYGSDFVSAVVDKNIIGVQFHPEKSHKFGMKLLENFVKI